MALFGDFEFTGPVPLASAWSAMGSQVQFMYPAPATLISPPCPYPHTLDIETTGISAAALQWRMSMVGYGDFALYGANWLIKTTKLSSAEEADLKRLAKARTAMMNRAYRLLPAGSSAPLRIVPRSIYPLIDPSEQVSISYALGCAMAEATAASAIATRPGATGTLTHLFHKRLLEIGSLSTQLIEVQSASGKAIDFIAFEGSSAEIHLVEAKGTGGSFDYPALHKGLLQCASVTGVSIMMLPPVLPKSLNVSCAYVAHTPVKCGTGTLDTSVRTAFFKFTRKGQATKHTEVENRLNKTAQAVKTLFGAKMVGLYMALLAAETTVAREEWLLFTFLVDPLDDQDQALLHELTVGLPTKMWKKLEQLWNEGQIEMGSARKAESLKAMLPNDPIDMPVSPDQYLEDVLYRFGNELLTTKPLWTNLVAPAEMQIDTFEPWLAFHNDSDNAHAKRQD